MRFFSNPRPLTCGRCSGLGRIETRRAVVGKGWVVSGTKCGNCRGRGVLRRR